MQRRLYTHSANIDCAMQCFTNQLDQNILSILEQQTSCLAENKQLQINLTSCNCIQDDYKQKYIQQSALLDDVNKEKEKLIIYEGHLQLIKSIGDRIKQMHNCKLQLKEYCSLIGKEELSGSEKVDIELLFSYLECKSEISKDHFSKVQAPFYRLLEHVLITKKNLTDLIIQGDFTKMKEAQEQENNFSSDNCHFICDIDVEDLDESSTYAKAFEAAWKIFSKIFL